MGLDGWVYGANGDSGGTVRSLRTGKTVSIGGRDFRFRPDTGEFEAESGQTQYGRHRDDWGHWFGDNNPNWAWHYVLADRDVRRNPHFAAPDPRHMLEPDGRRLYPASPTFARFNDPADVNHVTSANSPTAYRDDLFGPWYATSLFVSEPVHNLVHRIVLEPDGVTFRGHRGPNGEGREFLASSDNWFRPTMLKTGPDGALWVADMYRAVIEHPEWIPDDWEKRIDLRAGSQEGRIYRVLPVGQRARPIPRLDRLDEAGLVAALDSPNGWQRDTSQRLLLHRGGTSAFAALRNLAVHTRRPQARVQAIWTLADLGGVDVGSALAGLTDTDARVREAVVEAVEPLSGRSSSVADAVLRLVEDPEARVRFRLALLLGNWNDRRAGEALAKLARRDGRDRWMRAAILCSAVPHVPTLLAGLLGGDHSEAPPSEIVEPLLGLVGAVQGGKLNADMISSIGRPAGQGGHFAPWQYSALAGLFSAWERARTPLAIDANPALAGLLDSARRLVSEESGDEAERLAAISLLRYTAIRDGSDRDRLAALLRPRVPVALQQAAVTSLGRLNDPRVADILLAGWKGYSPQIRGAVLDALLSRREWTPALLTALEAGRVAPGEIDPARRQRLLKSRDSGLRSRTEALLAHEGQARKAVVEAYWPAVKMKGDPAAGASVFKKLCITCHRLGNEGVEVGPDLATLNDKSPESLLIAILDPNRALEAKYAAFTVGTVDGRVLSGLIASESATSVTLRRQEGKDDVLLRSDIEEMSTSGQSLMPEGLEKDLTPRDLADLIAYIATNRSVRKSE
jgi:putative heme-binding domain-containing protein